MAKAYVCPMCGASLLVVGNMYVCANNKCCYNYPLEVVIKERNYGSKTLKLPEVDTVTLNRINTTYILTDGEGLDGIGDCLNNFAESITETTGNNLDVTLKGSGEIIEGVVESAADGLAEGIIEGVIEGLTETVVEGIADVTGDVISGVFDAI